MKPVLPLIRVGMFLALGACANHPLDCASGLVAWDDCLPGTKGYEIRQSRLTRDDDLCKSYGLNFGTPEYAQCRVSLQNQSDANKQAAINAWMASRQQPPATPSPTKMPYQMPVNKTTNCTTNYYGNQAHTACQ